MVPSFDFTGFFISWQRTSIDDDEAASWVKRLEHPIKNGPGMHEFVVSVRYEDGINLSFW